MTDARRDGEDGRRSEPARVGSIADVPRREPAISVVIPVKDDAALLTRCLSALAAQDRPADEIIVVDNGSSDDSADRARAAGARVVRCEDPGIPAAASAGYDAADGDLILRLDADCVPEPGWVGAVATAFAAEADIAAFTGRARFTDGPVVLRAPLALIYLGAYRALLGLTLGHPPLFGSNLAFRREAWEAVRHEVHRDDPELHDDLDLAFHLGAGHRIGILTEVRMGMSMRPFTDGRFRRRVHRGYRSVVVHWPHDFPPRRWRRLAAERLHRRAQRMLA
ncbi:glycosyltransferase [Microbacterium foliorum]|uniref:glycosyltransferase n=1 Tax=Microbacterium foliorum TaxID=104336 RepID=UPI001D5D7E6E|nr:glycosyltransferase family 2 protein [Microbacterium foliorum]CAH0155464.1 Putative glycosyltransferase EpsH [Microbacterium foliorum]CAH0246952.1 Putative glycosyltransferase EpsH [Microbacterium foliorum]